MVKYWAAVEDAAKKAIKAGQDAAAANGGTSSTPAGDKIVQENPNPGGGNNGAGAQHKTAEELIDKYKKLNKKAQDVLDNFAKKEKKKADAKAWFRDMPANKRDEMWNVLKDGITQGELESHFAFGGLVPGAGNTDSIPAMLMPGEFVVNKMASARFRDVLQQMNSASGPRFKVPAAEGGIQAGVYNNNAQYTVNVAVNGSNASADEIANAVLGRVQQFENMKIRSYRS